MILKKLQNTTGNISCTADNNKRFKSFSVGQLKLLLAGLVCSLDKSAFKLITRTFGKNTDLTWKGIFPYEYLDSFNRFEETSLQPVESFYSKLNDESVSEQEEHDGAGVAHLRL